MNVIVAANRAGLGSPLSDGVIGLIRLGNSPDDFQKEFIWNLPRQRWESKEQIVVATDDAWAMDMSRQAISTFDNAYTRFKGGVSWYTAPRTVLRDNIALPQALIPVDNRISDFDNDGQVLIRNQLIHYTGRDLTPNLEFLTGCTGGAGAFLKDITPVIPWGALQGGDRGGWGTTPSHIDRAKEMWDAGFRLEERVHAWINGSQDLKAMTVGMYWRNFNLGEDMPVIPDPPAGGLGFGIQLVGPADPKAPNRLQERSFAWREQDWTAWSADPPAKRILIPTIYGKMAAGAKDNGEVYGYTYYVRWISP